MWTDQSVAFDAGPGVYSIASLCLFSFFTGAGSCSAFTAAIKAAALNFPEHRGTATAFPLAAFGLSAFFFATLALALPHDESHFLLLLATGTVCMPAASFFFLRTPSQHSYHQLHDHGSERPHTDRFSEHQRDSTGSDMPRPASPHRQPQLSSTKMSSTNASSNIDDLESSVTDSEQSSLLPHESDSPEDPKIVISTKDLRNIPHQPQSDIRGFRLLPHSEFWQLFCMLGLMTGIGLMLINNIGNIAQALWLRKDPATPDSFIARRQVLHVSLLSLMSFTGRLISGIGSDVLVRRFGMSRFWCLFGSSSVFVAAQICAITITNPTFLVFVSGLSGLAYGMLFGVYPSIVAHTFGVDGLSQNWGTMTLAPVISGNIFNLIYGTIYDSHSIVDDKTGDRQCLEGKACYEAAFWMTLCASIGALALCLWSIRHENKVHRARRRAESGKSKSSLVRLR